MHSASRTSAVIGGAVGGTIAGGPLGGVAGAIGAGNAVDGAFTVVESVVEGEWVLRGNLKGITDIAKGNVGYGLSEIILNTAGDALGGAGASAFLSSGKGAAKATIKEGSKAALKQALKQTASETAATAAAAIVTTSKLRKGPRKYYRKRRHRRYNYDLDSDDNKNSTDDNGKSDSSQQFSDEDEQSSDGNQKSSNEDQELSDEDQQYSDEDQQYSDEDQQSSSDEDQQSSEDEEQSTDDTSSELEESEEAQCQAILTNGDRCDQDSTANGACNRRTHQQQMRNRARQPYRLSLNLTCLEHIIGRNCGALQRRINNTIQDLLEYEDIGCIYVYTLANGNFKVGRTAQPDPRTRWNQQRQYEKKIKKKTWMCRMHTLAEKIILMILDFARLRNPAGNPIEEFDRDCIDRDSVETVIRAVIKAIHKAMKKRDRNNEEDEPSSDLFSNHYPDN